MSRCYHKDVNDTYGHLAGDKMLTSLTKTMQRNLRKGDDICRYGGDEFVIVFKECAMEEVGSIIERIRESMTQKPIHFKENKISSTISAGLCTAINEIKGENLIECVE